jgi:hypothetical protein
MLGAAEPMQNLLHNLGRSNGINITGTYPAQQLLTRQAQRMFPSRGEHDDSGVYEPGHV